MRTISDHLSLKYKAVVSQDETGDFIVEVPELPGCVADGPTLPEAFESLESAKRVWMESRVASGLDIPQPCETRPYSGKVLLRMPRSLHQRLSEQADSENVSLNQHLVSLLSEASAIRRREVGSAENLALQLQRLTEPNAPPNAVLDEFKKLELTKLKLWEDEFNELKLWTQEQMQMLTRRVR